MKYLLPLLIIILFIPVALSISEEYPTTPENQTNETANQRGQLTDDVQTAPKAQDIQCPTGFSLQNIENQILCISNSETSQEDITITDSISCETLENSIKVGSNVYTNFLDNKIYNKYECQNNLPIKKQFQITQPEKPPKQNPERKVEKDAFDKKSYQPYTWGLSSSISNIPIISEIIEWIIKLFKLQIGNPESGEPNTDTSCIPTNIRINTEGESEHEYDFPYAWNWQTGEIVETKTTRSPLGFYKDPLPENLYIMTVADVVFAVEIVADITGNPDNCTSHQIVKGTKSFLETITLDADGNIIDEEYKRTRGIPWPSELVWKKKRVYYYSDDFPNSPNANGKCPYENETYCNDDYQIEIPEDERSTNIKSGEGFISWFDSPSATHVKGNLTMDSVFISYAKGSDGTYCWIKWELHGEYDENNNPITELHTEIAQHGICSNNTDDIPREIKDFETRTK